MPIDTAIADHAGPPERKTNQVTKNPANCMPPNTDSYIRIFPTARAAVMTG